MSATVRFNIGQIVIHSRFDYRGVIFDVDPHFMLSDDWYRRVALSQPPKDQPWYHMLVDGQEHTTYVAERHLAAAEDSRPIQHPLLGHYFQELNDGSYQPKGLVS